MKASVLVNKMVKQEKEVLRTEIEMAREQLNKTLGESGDFDTCYLLSVKLDKLIAEYVELCEKEGA